MHATQHLTIEGPRAGRGKSGFDTAARPVTRGALVTATLRPSTSSPSMFATLRESSRTGGDGALMHASAVGGTTRRLQLAFERTRLHSRSLLRSRSEQMRSRAQAIVPKLHSKLQAASYQAGGQDWEGVYRFFDKNNDGALQYTELHSAVRRDLRFPPRGLPDDDIAMLFQLLDADGGGSVGLEELIGFLQDVNMVLSALNADPKRKFQNHKELLDAERKLDIAAREAREGALPWTPRLGGVVECEFRPDEWHLAQVSTKNYDPNTQAPTGRYTVRFLHAGRAPQRLSEPPAPTVRVHPYVPRSKLRVPGTHAARVDLDRRYIYGVGERVECRLAPQRWHGGTVASRDVDDGVAVFSVRLDAPLPDGTEIQRRVLVADVRWPSAASVHERLGWLEAAAAQAADDAEAGRAPSEETAETAAAARSLAFDPDNRDAMRCLLPKLAAFIRAEAARRQAEAEAEAQAEAVGGAAGTGRSPVAKASQDALAACRLIMTGRESRAPLL